MRTIAFEKDSWQKYEDPAQGKGQPEALKHEYSGYYSRHPSKKDRLIYRFDDECIYIVSIGGHYDDH